MPGAIGAPQNPSNEAQYVYPHVSTLQLCPIMEVVAFTFAISSFSFAMIAFSTATTALNKVKELEAQLSENNTDPHGST